MTLPHLLDEFLEEPGGHLAMDTDLRVVDIGPEFARLTKTKREDLVGKLFINVVTDPNQGRHSAFVEGIRTAAANVMKTRQTYKLPVARLDIMDPETRKAEERWWRPALIPVLRDSEVVYLVLRLEDVSTEERAFRGIQAQRRSNYILYVACVLILGLGLWGYGQLNTRTVKESHRTCDVQRLSLQGYHLIGHIMFDISGILHNSPRRPVQPVPPKERAFAQQLEQDLGQYLKVVHKLPKTRTCRP